MRVPMCTILVVSVAAVVIGRSWFADTGTGGLTVVETLPRVMIGITPSWITVAVLVWWVARWWGGRRSWHQGKHSTKLSQSVNDFERDAAVVVPHVVAVLDKQCACVDVGARKL